MLGKAGDFAGEGFTGGLVSLEIQADTTVQNSGQVVVKNPWNETWIPVPQGVSYTLLAKPTTCGDSFYQYTAGSPAQTGKGMRCVLRLTENSSPHEGDLPFTTVWFGNGQWQDRSYSHVGRLHIVGGGPDAVSGTGEADDICDGHFGVFCGAPRKIASRSTHSPVQHRANQVSHSAPLKDLKSEGLGTRCGR